MGVIGAGTGVGATGGVGVGATGGSTVAAGTGVTGGSTAAVVTGVAGVVGSTATASTLTFGSTRFPRSFHLIYHNIIYS